MVHPSYPQPYSFEAYFMYFDNSLGRGVAPSDFSADWNFFYPLKEHISEFDTF
jgi:hypothetical protein